MDIDSITPSFQRPFFPYQKTVFSFILSLLLFSTLVEAQTAPAWVRTLDSDSYNAGSDVAVAPTGDVYFSGVFEGQLFNVESKGSTDIWLTKVSSSGETEWITVMGGTGGEQAFRIVPDAEGNVFVSGTFEDVLAHGSWTLESRGQRDAFLAKFDALGRLVWIVQAGGTGTDRGIGITIDDAGCVYWSGGFERVGQFGEEGRVEKTSAGRTDTFVAKYTKDGALEWVETAGGINRDIATAVAVDAEGRVFLTGVTSGFSTLPQDVIRGEFSGIEDIFLARYTPSGSLEWIMYSGGPSFDAANGITVDSQGRLYITGYFEDRATFNSTNQQTASAEGIAFDVFLAQYNQDGLLHWVRTGGGERWDNAYDVTLDEAGNPHMTGLFRKEFYIGNQTPLEAMADGESNAYLVKFNPEGDVLGLQTIDGAKTEGHGVDIDPTGAIFMTGHFTNSVEFSDTQPAVNSSATNTFMAKYGDDTFGTQPPDLVPIIQDLPRTSVAEVSNFPNPFSDQTTISFNLRQEGSVRAIVYDLLGRAVRDITLPDLSAGQNRIPLRFPSLPSGMYVYSLEAEGEVSSYVMVRQ